MDLNEITRRRKCRPGLLGIEKLTIIYTLFTAVVAIIFSGEMPNLAGMLTGRAGILLGLAALVLIYKRYASRLTLFLRIAYQLALLAYWYPDTYLFCHVFPNLDNVFAAVEQTVFGCQPALLFSENFNGIFWSEIFNLGYFSYYPMIFFVVLWTFFKHYKYFEKTTFIIICSFFIYYLIFLFLPVAGPQYYFQAVGIDDIRNGIFPAVEYYFRYHTEMLPKVQTGGLFQHLVELAQKGGECPTAAFPSSHVGISTILLILTYKVKPKAVRGLLPFYLLLCFSTVYIQAHYLVDVLAGLVTAPIVYKVSHKIYYTHTFHRKRGYHS